MANHPDVFSSLEIFSGIRIEPRDYQRRVVARVIEMFSGPHVERRQQLPEARSVVIESPTGSGKTAMGLLVAKWAQETLGMRVVWAAMRRNLLTQVARENRDRGFGVDLATVSMFEKSPPRGDLLVVDEAHHDATRSMASLHAAVGPVKVLGLTATPWRSDRLALCFERTVRDAGIRQLVLDGHLSPFAHFTLTHYTPRSVADAWLREPDRWGPTLAFFRTLAECRECADSLGTAGVACEVVSATSDREAQIARFKAGACRVLIGVGVLAEGFDCPRLTTVFCRPAGRGPTVQMAGRVLRRADGIAVKNAIKNIVQCAATRHPFPKTATPAVQFLQEGVAWRSVGMNRRVAEVEARMLQILVTMSKTAAAEAAAAGQRARRACRRGPRAIRRWDYRISELADRVRREKRHGAIPQETTRRAE